MPEKKKTDTTIAEVIIAILRLPLLKWVPEGYLTLASSYLQIVVGVGLLAVVISDYIAEGTIPSEEVLGGALGMLLFGNGAQGVGIRRKLPGGR